MTKKIYYEKVGRRYKPVAEYDHGLMDALPRGNHLISVYPGGQSNRYNIDPNYAALIAAGRVAEGPMHDAIRKAVEMRNRSDNKLLTKEQLEAWQRFVDVMGASGQYIHYNSVHDIAEAGLQALKEEAAKLMKHASVQKAYEDFLLVCKLCKENEDVQY